MEVCSIVDLNPRERRWVIHCRVTSKSPIYNYGNDRGEGQVITVDLKDASVSSALAKPCSVYTCTQHYSYDVHTVIL